MNEVKEEKEKKNGVEGKSRFDRRFVSLIKGPNCLAKSSRLFFLIKNERAIESFSFVFFFFVPCFVRGTVSEFLRSWMRYFIYKAKCLINFLLLLSKCLSGVCIRVHNGPRTSYYTRSCS